ncbi:SWIM zinc finger family protein [Streptomyces odontomachi]|uniref:SWIM zinc finger family protein n=1 Tax=Streptomyces odontomachi TaxID=2944940 RepID=UPI00210ADF58|nr:SWIM zinc finger family protein [Streptomyces sp. ODS25]
MTEQGVRWTADQVLALAPDAASRKAGSKLGAAGPWSDTGGDEGAIWGLCKGSGSKPYQTVVDIAGSTGPAYKCSCPSRKFPCKHALGLLLLWTGADDWGSAPEAPAWAEEWLTGRRKRAAEKPAAPARRDQGAPADPAAQRRADIRAQQRAERVSAGATELEQRLSDLLRGGLAGAEQAGYGLWEETAARMVDAQAPGLAARVRELGPVATSGPGWPLRLLEECALIHLLDQGWLHRSDLPPGLATTVRARIGLPTPADGPTERDQWLVLAQYDTADTKLTTRRIWLYGTGSGRTALLLSYGAAGRPPALALPVGLAFDAELSAHPGPAQLRAELGERFSAPVPTAARPSAVTTSEATARYGTALRDDPWLDSWPVTLGPVIPAPLPDGSGWQLADADGGLAVPITASAPAAPPGLWRLVALSGGAPVTVFGECGHRGFTPLAAWPQGPGETVALC